jgi:hypothetical protein
MKKQNKQQDIINVLEQEGPMSESEIFESAFGYYRNSSGESNKKYADLLRRTLRSGKITRERVTGKSHRFEYKINNNQKPTYDITNSNRIEIKTDETSKEVRCIIIMAIIG